MPDVLQSGRERGWAALIALCLVLFGSSVHADDDDKAMARALFKQGDVHYRVAEFAEALDKYREAYRLHNHPAIVFNIAQCHRQLKQHEKALFFYKLYLSVWRKRDVLTPANHQEVKGHIQQLTALLQAQRKEAQRKEAQRKEAQRKQAAAARAARQAAAAARVPLIPRPGGAKHSAPPAPRPIYKRWWFWTAVGVVVAGATVGVVVASQPGEADGIRGTLSPGNFDVD